MIALALFVSTFALVFALGFQSLNVNNGHYWAAALTSLAIGSMQLVLFKLVPGATNIEVIAFVAGGPFGIVASMWAHRRTLGRKRKDDLTITIGCDASQAIAGLQSASDGMNEIAAACKRTAHALERANINCGADRP